VNKVDGRKDKEMLGDFYRLGIEEFYPISAQHGPGVDDLMAKVTGEFPSVTDNKDADDDLIRIAIIGKPNVGKSSLVNRILGKERSIANPLPGTTRDAIDQPVKVNGKNYLIIDTAGIRKKSKISLTLEQYSVVQALKSINRCDIALVLIDAEEGMTDQDVKIAGVTYEHGKACIIVVNKWDKIEKDNSTIGKFVEDIKFKLKFMDFAPIIFISAITGQRAPKIFDLVDEIYLQYSKRVPTSQLNDFIERAVRNKPIPHYQNREQHISYATQVDTKPPSFVLFVGNIKGIHFSYERYLINQIRANFGFDKVPIKITFRKKR
jgi:GTP-binding protein